MSEKGRNAGGKEAGRLGGKDSLPVPTREHRREEPCHPGGSVQGQAAAASGTRLVLQVVLLLPQVLPLPNSRGIVWCPRRVTTLWDFWHLGKPLTRRPVAFLPRSAWASPRAASCPWVHRQPVRSSCLSGVTAAPQNVLLYIVLGRSSLEKGCGPGLLLRGAC